MVGLVHLYYVYTVIMHSNLLLELLGVIVLLEIARSKCQNHSKPLLVYKITIVDDEIPIHCYLNQLYKSPNRWVFSTLSISPFYTHSTSHTSHVDCCLSSTLPCSHDEPVMSWGLASKKCCFSKPKC